MQEKKQSMTLDDLRHEFADAMANITTEMARMRRVQKILDQQVVSLNEKLGNKEGGE